MQTANYLKIFKNKFISIKKNKCLRINLHTEVKDLFTKNSKTGGKMEAQINSRLCCIYGLEKVTLLECPYYPRRSIHATHSLLKSHELFPQKSRKGTHKICI